MNKEFENKLYNEIVELTPKVYHTGQLPEHDLHTAINDTMLTMLKKFDAGIVPSENYEDYKGYMYIVYSRCVLRYFQTKKELAYYSKVTLVDETEAFENSFISFDNNTYDMKLIYSLINSLKPEDRQLINLRIEGYTAAEISVITGLSISIVKNHTFKLLKQLKEAIKPANTTPVKSLRYHVTDITTNKVESFRFLSEICRYYDYTHDYLRKCLKKGKLVNKRYKITKN